MRDTLENLYFGNITPNDQIVKSGTALKKAMEQSAECEKKLNALIQAMQAERQALLDQARGVTPPDKLTKTQKKIWMYMKFHPDVSSYRAIARGAGVTRHTAAKWYAMMQGMLGAGNLK